MYHKRHLTLIGHWSHQGRLKNSDAQAGSHNNSGRVSELGTLLAAIRNSSGDSSVEFGVENFINSFRIGASMHA